MIQILEKLMQILDDNIGKSEEIADSERKLCEHCKERTAEIFQVTGDFCLECWQIVTHTNP